MPLLGFPFKGRKWKMYNVVVADDETIIRTSITTLINWKVIGFQVIGDAVNGKGVLAILEDNHVDVVITDIKMPIMDGIELIENLMLRKNPPLIIVLSAYNDFLLVRNAFKLGAVDYILKSDISEIVLKECMLNLKKQLDNKGYQHQLVDNSVPVLESDTNQEEILKEIILGKKEVQEKFFTERYHLVCLEIEDFDQQILQFGKDIQASFVHPLINFAKQIPRVASKCIVISISPSRYILCYSAEGEAMEQVKSISRQVMNVWKNYMNISVSVGISSMGGEEGSFPRCLQEVYHALSMKYIFGKEQVYTPEHWGKFDVIRALETRESYRALVSSIKQADNDVMLKEQRKFFSIISTMTLQEAKRECLNLIYYIAMMFAEGHDTAWNAYYKNTDFYHTISRLKDIRDMEMWLVNFIRGIVEYIENQYDHKSMDMIELAKSFIGDHYSDPAISLGAVAEFVNLSEKYFSTRFRKETGTSFVGYLTELRIKKAQEMIERTNMKIYEISEAVGYGSVEHFTRVFKKVTGRAPSAYDRDYE